MIRALIDLDPMKYAVAFASQHDEYYKLGVNCPAWEAIEAMACTSDMNPYAYAKAAGFVQECLMIKQVKGQKGRQLVHEDGTTEQFEDVKKISVLADSLGLVGPGIILDPLANCLHSVRMMVNKVLRATGAGTYTAYLSKGDCFRVKVYPYTLGEDGIPLKDEAGRRIGYKANRIGTAKPLYMPDIEAYMTKKFKAVVCTEIEADDAICIEHVQSQDETVICTIDKDLDGCPGWHYNWNTKIMRDISPDESLTLYWGQVLSGDSVDHIPGLVGIAKKGAMEMLKDVPVPEMRELVLKEYLSRGHDEAFFKMNCILLWMLRKPLAETYPNEEWAHE